MRMLRPLAVFGCLLLCANPVSTWAADKAPARAGKLQQALAESQQANADLAARVEKLEHALAESQQSQQDLTQANATLEEHVAQIGEALRKISMPLAGQIDAAMAQRAGTLDADNQRRIEARLTKLDESDRKQLETALRDVEARQKQAFKEQFAAESKTNQDSLAAASSAMAEKNRAQTQAESAALGTDLQAKADAALRSARLAESREWTLQSDVTARLGKLETTAGDACISSLSQRLAVLEDQAARRKAGARRATKKKPADSPPASAAQADPCAVPVPAAVH